jgi:hypothetical protein
MTDILDLYCERTGPEYLSEPLNAATNLVFIVAGLMAWRLWRKEPRAGWRSSADLLLLVGLLFAIGIGSTVWHLMPTRATKLGDQIPILLFMNVYLLVFLIRVLGLRWATTLALFAFYHVANFAIARTFPPDFLNGSVFYAPTWIALVVMVAFLFTRRDPAARGFAAAFGVFTASIFFRSIDEAICRALPIGTHFLWHLLNGVVLYLFAAIAIRSDRRVSHGHPDVRLPESPHRAPDIR